MHCRLKCDTQRDAYAPAEDDEECEIRRGSGIGTAGFLAHRLDYKLSSHESNSTKDGRILLGCTRDSLRSVTGARAQA